jgi:ABC-type lipoprotein export system ATPase subunit
MAPVLELTRVVKDYRGLRPLRVRDLAVSAGEIVAVAGLDLAASEILTNLITGATLPDEGSVRVFGQDTSAITDADAWLTGLDRFGIVSDRVALLDAFSVRQNIALSLTLDLDELSDDVAARVGQVAASVGLDAHELDIPAGSVSPSARLRVRLARALLPSPRLLLMEHPTASMPRADVPRLASVLFKLVRERRCSTLVASADRDFTSTADREFVLDPATGGLRRQGVRAWFPRQRR